MLLALVTVDILGSFRSHWSYPALQSKRYSTSASVSPLCHEPHSWCPAEDPLMPSHTKFCVYKAHGKDRVPNSDLPMMTLSYQ